MFLYNQIFQVQIIIIDTNISVSLRFNYKFFKNANSLSICPHMVPGLKPQAYCCRHTPHNIYTQSSSSDQNTNTTFSNQPKSKNRNLLLPPYSISHNIHPIHPSRLNPQFWQINQSCPYQPSMPKNSKFSSIKIPKNLP